MGSFKSQLIPSMAEAEADQAKAQVQQEKDKAAEQAAEDLAQRIAEVETEVAWLDIGKMISQPPPPLDFVIPGMLAGTVASLVSPGGAGKSFLALELAVLIATSVDVAGLTMSPDWSSKPKRGKVLYIALEDAASVLSHRLHDIGTKAKGITQVNSFGKALAASMRLASIPAGMDLLSMGWKEWFALQCEGMRLVVIDTFRLAHQGDENSAGEMARVMAALGSVAAKTGAGILFLHHTSKAAATEGRVDAQQAARGSSVIVDNARGGFYLQKMTSDESKILVDTMIPNNTQTVGDNRWQYVRFGISKANAGKPWDAIWLRKGANGVLQWTRLVEQTGRASQKNRKNAQQDADDL
jgi:RecA-family ATPase